MVDVLVGDARPVEPACASTPVSSSNRSTLSALDTSLSENNLFGWRKFLSVGFVLDLGKYGIGPTYFDPNIAGTRLQLWANALAFYTRDSGAYEGNSETLSLVYPLYSLASRWGAAARLLARGRGPPPLQEHRPHAQPLRSIRA